MELNDRENIELIEQALADYKDGALYEAKCALCKVIERIEMWEQVYD